MKIYVQEIGKQRFLHLDSQPSSGPIRVKDKASFQMTRLLVLFISFRFDVFLILIYSNSNNRLVILACLTAKEYTLNQQVFRPSMEKK